MTDPTAYLGPVRCPVCGLTTHGIVRFCCGAYRHYFAHRAAQEQPPLLKLMEEGDGDLGRPYLPGRDGGWLCRDVAP